MKSTPDLCDTYPNIVRVLAPLFKNFGGLEQFSGPVVTVKCFEDNSLVKEILGTPGYGRILVVDAGGSMRRACLGDLLAQQALDNDWRGVIMYGCVRDADEIKTINVGIQALGTHPMKTEKKGIGEQGLTVTFAGVTISPGDYVYADNNGVLVSSTELI
ncbi:MAG: ribonuclease E activity regulator RraA [Porticoccaceae bacterium]|nr:ribonuclease E activity regulator RraA [Porticoccaceae bacterium]MDG1473873.1 ribonuclease E activity regulator RraA [Porticoccaceae bacterium]